MEDMVADDAGAVEGRSRTAAPRCAVLSLYCTDGGTLG